MTYGPDYPRVRDKEVEKEILHFEDVAQPVFVNVAETGAWPPGASFVYFIFRQDDNLVRYDCLCLRVQVETPGTLFTAFALPILDLYFGGVPPPARTMCSCRPGVQRSCTSFEVSLRFTSSQRPQTIRRLPSTV